MFYKVFGSVVALIGSFVIFVAAVSKTPEGHPIASGWLIGIIGICTIEVGVAIFFTHDWD